VVRDLVYLFGEDRLMVHDQVVAVEPSYIKKWLLHTVNRPEIAELRLIKGVADNGILVSTVDTALVSNGRGRLIVQRLLPADGVMRMVGGPDYRYYVETDGDEHELNGVNFKEGASAKPWFDVASWRLEIQPGTLRETDTFLVALSPSLDNPRDGERLSTLRDTENAVGASGRDSILVFIESAILGRAGFTIEAGAWTLRLVGLPVGGMTEIIIGDYRYSCLASQGGVCRFTLPDGPRRRVRVEWR
jgi:hypothetical protein